MRTPTNPGPSPEERRYIETFDRSAVTIVTQSASAREQRSAQILVGVLFAASLIAWPLRRHAFATATSFIPAFAGTTGTVDALASVLLFALYRIDGTRFVLFAAGAYLFDAVLIVPYAVTFPGVADPYGFVGNEQSAAWMWVIWHFSFPIIVVAGSSSRWRIADAHRRSRDVVRTIGLVLLVGSAAILLVTGQQGPLPVLVHRGAFSALFTLLSFSASCANFAAAVILFKLERPVHTLRLWLIVAVVASGLDTALNAISPARFSAAWYVGKAETFVTASIVLVTLLAAWSTLYARSMYLALRLSNTLGERRLLEETLEREHRVSIALQEASLPRTLPRFDHVLVHAAYHPGNDEATIGGDWYDAFALADGRIALTIGDVIGNGLRAALTMSKLRQAMQTAAMIHPDPATMLDVADETLRLHDSGGYATAVAAIYDPATHRTSFASAGHLAPMLRTAHGNVQVNERHGSMLGLGIKDRRTVAEIATPPGSMLVLYTDGLVESTRDLIEGERRLGEAVANTAVMTSGDPAAAIVRAVLGSTTASDDVAVLTVTFVAAPVAQNARPANEAANGCRVRFQTSGPTEG
ncbi:MAG: hypothetical protein NVS3B28_28620 [Candidatus Velthaea sp.]